MMSDFAQKYPKSSPNPKIAQNSVQDYCLTLLAMQLVIFVYLTNLQPMYLVDIHLLQINKTTINTELIHIMLSKPCVT